jgi:hypothetical protein
MGVLVAAAALFHAACAMVIPSEGEFENRTNYYITVTIVGSNFGIWSESAQEFTPATSASFGVDSLRTVKIQSSADTIKFNWTTRSVDANRKISVVNDGNTVIFKE